MKRTITLLLGASLISINSFAQTVQSQYLVDTITLKSEVFNNTRRLRVLLPPEYFTDAAASSRYPVLYMNDGVATFHAYDIQNVVHRLINENLIEPIIVVGIDNGASTLESTNPARDRANEYLPWPDLLETAPNLKLDNPQGEKYPQFFHKEVMPKINSLFRTSTAVEHTGLGGASRGALISLYTAIEKPGVIGKLLLESPSLYVYNEQILKNSAKNKTWPGRIYLGTGTDEGETEAIQEMALAHVKKLESILKRDSKVETHCVVEEGGTHDYPHFAGRFEAALKFLFGRN